ncbi:MAG TPA: FecR domain-containing protein [Polyangia bacterium]|nr:FecR domain-containing protein [Polyangia bacterium]
MNRDGSQGDAQDPASQAHVEAVVRTIDARVDREMRRRPPQPPRLAGIPSAGEGAARRFARLSAIGLACAAAVVALLWLRRPAPGPGDQTLTYTVNGQPPAQGGYVTSEVTSEPLLSFSDGTRVRLARRTRGRVVELARRGARIALEDGVADVEVVHRPGAQWVFEAGPFVIAVHGTAFSLGWSARDARLDLKMRSGVVSVAGPVPGGELELKAGQSLALTVGRDAPARIEGPPDGPGLSPPAAESSSGARPARREIKLDWATRLANGDSAGIVGEARRRGVAWVLESSSSADLSALADAARFQRDGELARQALRAQRRRFAGSPRAAEASFLLGRLEDETDSGRARALAWYDRYLKEAPDGTYVSEALGRQMLVLEETGQHAAAAVIAADYLRRFAGGTYAHAARAILRAR